ncbi:MAG TPA: sigma-54 dependent transcriptional regulator [Kofleriaceae bacterium]|jgi:two-component system response regulator AtoC|nr:sigma-54 dependent transcriptional regulator [Kofleriaceae bacterium]
MTKVLIIDDEPALRFAVQEALEAHGLEVIAADSAAAALAALDDADVVVSDYMMPDIDGMQLLEKVRIANPALPVILVTAHGSERLAVRALKQGAYDYLSKPFDNDELCFTIDRAAETRRLRQAERERALEQASGVRIIGRSPALTRVLDTATRIAAKDVTVLVRGETGTGKELIASLLHANSPRARQPLVVFNSAAIPAELAESQLFGHAKGAFTGAVAAHDGYFVQADGGTLFIDEIGELPLALQAKLLRVLQEREVQPLGAAQVKKIDVRVVAATHRDLAEEVKAGRFREDLYYRLNVIELRMPPLRERRADVPLLAREFARKYSERFGLGYVVQLSPELIAHLEQQAWPGNVRQLENTIARCAALATTKIVGLEVLQAPHDAPPDAADPADPGDGSLPSAGPSFREQVEAFERNLITQAIRSSGGNQSETARRLQLNRATLYDKLKKYGLTRE